MDEMIVELANSIKGAAKSIPTFEGFIVGKVLEKPPEIKIAIDEAIILDKTHLVIAAHVLKEYEREFEIFEGEEIIINGSLPNTFTAKGKIKWTDTLKKDDLVILVPAGNQQMYILIDKAVEL